MFGDIGYTFGLLVDDNDDEILGLNKSYFEYYEDYFYYTVDLDFINYGRPSLLEESFFYISNSFYYSGENPLST